MNHLIITFTAICSLMFMNAENKNTATLEIEISEFRNTDGHLLVSLYRNEKNFNDGAENAFRNKKVKVDGKKMSVSFEDLPFGEYAILFLHDENNDEEMDTNMVGIPQEGYGASNNAVNTFSAPKYKDAKFTIDRNTISTSLKIYY